jgi:predicted acetyltransferase
VLAVATPAGELRGYALFRRRSKWEHHAPAGTVEVEEAVALDGAASRALWGRLTDLDLIASVRTPLLPVDDPLSHLLVDPRAARPELTDGVWARLVDVPAALAQRGYATDVDVVLAVTDALLPANAGRWRLTGGPSGGGPGGGARCEPTDAPAQLTVDVRELGAAYLGGCTLAELAGAGLIGATDERALERTSVAFTSPVAPHCGWIF